MEIVTPFLPGGPGSWSEQFRHECEVRLLASWRVIECRRFLEGVAQKRGQPAADRLRADIAEHFEQARELAAMATNTGRALRLRQVALERGPAFAQGLRETTWALMQERRAA